MYGILVSALNYLLAWVFRAVVFKAMIFGVLYFITTEFMAVVTAHLANSPAGSLQSSVNGLSGAVLWAFGVFRLDVGLPMLVSAAGLAFAIRRIPVIG